MLSVIHDSVNFLGGHRQPPQAKVENQPPAVIDSRYRAGCGSLFLYQREMESNYGGAEVIAPASLGHVAVPVLDLLFGGSASFLKTPLEHLVVGTASTPSGVSCSATH
jgi:hypothetical protein